MRRKWIARSAIAAASVALVVSAAGTAQAAPGQGGGCLRPLIESGVITQDQAYELREATDALKASGVQGREARDKALVDLVANGTLTQSQADAISAARPRQRPGAPAEDRIGAAPAAPANAGSGTGTPSYDSYSRS